MNLVIDVGNTFTKWALVDTGIREKGCLQWRDDAEAQLGAAWDRIEAPQAVMLCSVASEQYDDIIGKWTWAHWGVDTQKFQVSRITCGIRTEYADPTQLGNDRMAAVIGARQLSPGALGVIDAGSAVTLDVLSEDDRHLGGFILPGPRLMQESLWQRAARIPPGVFDKPDGVLGTSTDACIRNGSVLGLAGAIDHLMTLAQGETGVNLRWFVCGGAWAELKPFMGCTNGLQEEPDLVLLGLAAVLRQTPAAVGRE